jgi:hypothetical protein
MSWQPVLTADLAEHGRRAIQEISTTIPAARPDLAPDLTLWWAYATQDDSEPYDAATDALVRRASIPHGDLRLQGGLADVGFALAHVTDGNADDVLATVDQTLIDAMRAWTGPADLVSGLAGVGVYFLERGLDVDGIVDVVDRAAVTNAAGTTWSADGRYICGTAHGVPGIVSVLARLGSPRATELCRGGLRWMRAQRRDDPHACFPSWIENGKPVGWPRNAWCYGDPGVAVACWGAAARIGEPVDEWRELALVAAARPEGDCLVDSAGLCHGAFGLSHLFNRCFQATGDGRFADASRRWFAHGLAMPLPREHDLMLGTTGIGLALLAALGDEEPGWDRMLACDLPPMDHAAGESDSV